jgi:hypothetical protein
MVPAASLWPTVLMQRWRRCAHREQRTCTDQRWIASGSQIWTRGVFVKRKRWKTMADGQKAYELLMRAEGRKHHTSEHDRGGETAAGITRRFWPDWPGWPLLDAGITWPDEALEREVYRFYIFEPRQKGMYGGFWSTLRCDDIRDQRVADRLLLFAVVAGASVAAKTLQRVLAEVTALRSMG